MSLNSTHSMLFASLLCRQYFAIYYCVALLLYLSIFVLYVCVAHRCRFFIFRYLRVVQWTNGLLVAYFCIYLLILLLLLGFFWCCWCRLLFGWWSFFFFVHLLDSCLVSYRWMHFRIYMNMFFIFKLFFWFISRYLLSHSLNFGDNISIPSNIHVFYFYMCMINFSFILYVFCLFEKSNLRHSHYFVIYLFSLCELTMSNTYRISYSRISAIFCCFVSLPDFLSKISQ